MSANQFAKSVSDRLTRADRYTQSDLYAIADRLARADFDPYGESEPLSWYDPAVTDADRDAARALLNRAPDGHGVEGP